MLKLFMHKNCPECQSFKMILDFKKVNYILCYIDDKSTRELDENITNLIDKNDAPFLINDFGIVIKNIDNI